MYGTQTKVIELACDFEFENDVKMYGTQTYKVEQVTFYCLRMM